MAAQRRSDLPASTRSDGELHGGQMHGRDLWHSCSRCSRNSSPLASGPEVVGYAGRDLLAPGSNPPRGATKARLRTAA
jgi:hypothetical protein